ncbi:MULTISPECIES: hypothetical protein [Pseudoalteromonas]|uniref:Benenodin family lasso peptide n=1 Tax=Pseudoalteromonas obscura TaxID=3048491 RepID=A0ABT7ERW6_9GAMM|nr:MULTISPECIES: hypothetical protein [Pseudoalteromonas]MBQ4839863.1 hypothetical protein [Pseudoalteromonas luteoviolacea]MDK2597789.1 hypothetical protein [Pseudoalteromonas sp. P94(2023)]
MKTSKQNKKAVIQAEELLAKIEGGSSLSNNYPSQSKEQDELGMEASGPGVQIYGTPNND